MGFSFRSMWAFFLQHKNFLSNETLRVIIQRRYELWWVLILPVLPSKQNVDHRRFFISLFFIWLWSSGHNYQINGSSSKKAQVIWIPITKNSWMHLKRTGVGGKNELWRMEQIIFHYQNYWFRNWEETFFCLWFQLRSSNITCSQKIEFETVYYYVSESIGADSINAHPDRRKQTHGDGASDSWANVKKRALSHAFCYFAPSQRSMLSVLESNDARLCE